VAYTEKIQLMLRYRSHLPAATKIAGQILFWTVAYFTLLNIFSGSGSWQKIDYLYTSIFMTTLIMAVTVNFWIILPRYLSRKRYALFFLFTAVNIAASTFFNQILFSKLIDYILPGYYFISYYDYFDLLKFFFVFVGLTTLIHLSWEWFQLQETRHLLVMLEKEKINAEFKALMNQVNPHFLFNSLTVLYSLSLKNAAETPGAIIKLSDILRYVIYESAAGEVPLSSEITLLHNYIDLQRYRVDASARITFNTDVQDPAIPIVSMILLPLVENSFKHGVKGDIENTFIDIQLHAVQGVITFNIVNNKSDTEPAEKPAGGIGLKNIEERLNLIYGSRYTLTVDRTAKTFKVKLTINTLP
jgi:hypothetical protein